jgi:hypothetical protein
MNSVLKETFIVHPLPTLRAYAPYQHSVGLGRDLALTYPIDWGKKSIAAVIGLTAIGPIFNLFIIWPHPSSECWHCDAHYINDIHMVGRNKFYCLVVLALAIHDMLVRFLQFLRVVR